MASKFVQSDQLSRTLTLHSFLPTKDPSTQDHSLTHRDGSHEAFASQLGQGTACLARKNSPYKPSGIKRYFTGSTGAAGNPPVRDSEEPETKRLRMDDGSRETDGQSAVDPLCCERCPECQELVPVWLLAEHSDYHFALRLQAGEQQPHPQGSRSSKGTIQRYFVKK